MSDPELTSMRHYAFAHRVFPQFAFREPLLLFRILASSQGGTLLREVWAASAEAAGVRPDDPRLRRAEPHVEVTQVGPHRCAVIAMPQPSRAPLAHYIALVLGSESAAAGAAAESGPPLFYFTLERASGDEDALTTMLEGRDDLLRSSCGVWGGARATVLCEWTRDGVHANLGEGPRAELEPFLAAVAKRVAASAEREKSASRIRPRPAPPAAPRPAGAEPSTAADPPAIERVRRCLHLLRRHDPETGWHAYSFDPEGMIRRPRPAETIIGLRAKAVPVLIEALDRGDRRAWAALLLGLLGREARAAVPGLIRSLGDPQALVRALAAEALGYIGYHSGRAVPALIDRLHDLDPRVRMASAGALGKLGAPATPAVEPLLDLLDDSDRGVRDWTSWAIRRIASDPG